MTEFVTCASAYVASGLSDQARGDATTLESRSATFVDPRSYEQPHRVFVPGFRISIFPVTRIEFLRWVFECAAILPENELAYWQTFDRTASYADSSPIITVTLDEASAFCASKGGRLPYYHEWLMAARGPAEPGRISSLGDERLFAGANWPGDWDPFQPAADYLVPVQDGAAPSWCGARDLLGNSDEFTASPSRAGGTQESESLDERRMTYMRCGIGTPVRSAAYAHWHVPRLRHGNGTLMRPTQIGFRIAVDCE